MRGLGRLIAKENLATNLQGAAPNAQLTLKILICDFSAAGTKNVDAINLAGLGGSGDCVACRLSRWCRVRFRALSVRLKQFDAGKRIGGIHELKSYVGLGDQFERL